MIRCLRCRHENPDGARFCNACGAPLAAATEERRKPATLLFCDVADSTALADRIDAEAMRELLAAYFVAARGAIEAHGGTVEKFIGDAVLGVFGVPVAHEDDALRAVRAAAELRARLAGLNDDLERRFGTRLAVRMGVETGEVVAGDARAGEGFVSGDVVNVAARLQQAAPTDAILLGETTVALVGEAAEVDELPALALKGKSRPVVAFALRSVRAEPQRGPRAASAPFVARREELALLRERLAALRDAERASRLLVVGEAGVGKSRLVETALAAEPGLRVIGVRCLPYGDGITYHPLVQLVRRAAGVAEGDDAATGRRRLDLLLGTQPDGRAAAAVLAQVLGVGDGVASPAEIAWAARRLAEALCRDRPLVLVVDDLQWAEEPFVELLRDLAERGRGPVLVLCLARPEPDGPGWEADLLLQPLAGPDAEELLAHLVPLDGPAQARLLAAAGGNPLFLEELAAFVDATGAAALPPTLDALLTARLDALPPDDRRTVECGSVEGQVFHRSAVLELTEDPPDALDRALSRLGGAGVVRAAAPTFAGEQAFEFRHLLVRDAAYRCTPKRRRAALHLRFADWLERMLGSRVGEAAEIVGYHLEQVWRLRSELGPLDAETRAVGARAAELLAGAARRSSARGDAVAALALLTRACALVPHDPTLALERGIAAREAGHFALSQAVLESVRDGATGAVAARADLELALLEFHLRPVGTATRLRAAGEAALTTFERLGDAHGRAVALSVLAQERWLTLRCAEMEALLEQALALAETARDDRLTASILVALARSVLFGPRAADEAAERCEELLARARRISPTTEASISMMLGVLEATRGRAERARELGRTSIAVLEETAPELRVAIAEQYAGLAELTLAEPERAEAHLRRSFALFERLGERAIASTAAALLARTLAALGRFAEAEQLATTALEWSDEDDVATQAFARGALAFALLARGDGADARRQAEEAAALASAGDWINQRGDAHLDLAAVLYALGDADAARRAADAALSFFAAKGNHPAAARLRIRLTPFTGGRRLASPDDKEAAVDSTTEEPDRPAPDDEPDEEAQPGPLGPEPFPLGPEVDEDDTDDDGR